MSAPASASPVLTGLDASRFATHLSQRAYLPAWWLDAKQSAWDRFNALLNYLYGMLYTVVETGIFAAGLDPQLGLLHADEYNKPVLAFDFIEPFRPWADRLLIEQYQQGAVSRQFFTKIPDGIILNKEGKAFIIPLFNGWLRTERTWGGRKTNVRNHIYQLAGRFAQKLRDMPA